MGHELPYHGSTNDNTDETEPPRSETIAHQVLKGERSNATGTHDGIPYPCEQSNTSQISVQKPNYNDTSFPLEQLPQLPGDKTSHGGESIHGNVQPAASSDLPSDENNWDSEDESIRIQNEIGGYERLSPKVEGEFLDMIRIKLLRLLGAGTEDVQHVRLHNYGIETMRFKMDNDTIGNLAWSSKPGTNASTEAILAKPSICRAWPQDRNVDQVTQFVLESDGSVSALKIPWGSTHRAYQSDLDEPHRRDISPLGFKRTNKVECAAYEDTWHRWCFEAARRHPVLFGELPELSRRKCGGKIVYCTSSGHQKGFQFFPLAVFATALSNDEPFSVPDPKQDCFDVGRSTSFFSAYFKGNCKSYSDRLDRTHVIHWQIRYFRPVSRGTGDNTNYLLSERQSATIRQGSEEILVQEKRARITFRVPKGSPNLFHILILSDDWLVSSIDCSHLISREDAQSVWSRYGLEAGEEIIPVTHLLLEICMAFSKSMDAWDRTINSIDRFVHVNLSDLDGQEQVEDLMFDKSFSRSKNYFIALQLLRIVDEWVEEIIPSMQGLRDSPLFKHPAPNSSQAIKNLNAADKYIGECAGAVQRRVRKKTAEINSLRDGLFNATSLRESTKAMTLNQAIYVFTVVTVLFTPVSFLATFWALPFLNNPREGSDVVPEPSSFRSSFIMMPLFTYALVIGIAWHVGRENPNGALLSLVKDTWKELRQLPRSLWELCPRLPERKKTKSSNV